MTMCYKYLWQYNIESKVLIPKKDEKTKKDENGSGQAIIFRISEIILDRGDKSEGY